MGNSLLRSHYNPTTNFRASRITLAQGYTHVDDQISEYQTKNRAPARNKAFGMHNLQ